MQVSTYRGAVTAGGPYHVDAPSLMFVAGAAPVVMVLTIALGVVIDPDISIFAAPYRLPEGMAS